MRIAQRADLAVSAVCHVFEIIVSAMLIFITLLISAQVVCRAFFNYSITWAEEVALICFIYITFMTLAIAMRSDSHLRVELAVSWMPRRAKAAVEFLDNLILLGISVLMIYEGIKLTQYGVASIMPATRWPTSVIYLPTPLAGVLCFMQQLLRLFGATRSENAEKFIGEETKQ